MNLAGIETNSVTDGKGVRLTIFFQGCPHKCVGCHNPDTWAYTNKNEVSVGEVLDLLDNEPIYKGITLSGGEPFSLQNLEEMTHLLKAVSKREQKDVWIYTGYKFEELVGTPFGALLPYIAVIVDGKFECDNRYPIKTFRGSRNQRLVDVQYYLSSGEIREVE